MRFALFTFLVLAVSVAPGVANQHETLAGTWSGTWTPPSGGRDNITIELKIDGSKVTGKFLTPTALGFARATYNPTTRSLLIEAADPSGKQFRLNGRTDTTRFTGTANINGEQGSFELVKWTHFR